MIERRRFLNLMSFGVVGAAAPAAVMANQAPKVNSNPDKDGPICAETLSIQSGTKKASLKKSDYGQFTFISDHYEEYKSVAMAVGKDGNLWLKNETDGWKRVVTE